jgi:hypothetical protein
LLGKLADGERGFFGGHEQVSSELREPKREGVVRAG